MSGLIGQCTWARNRAKPAMLKNERILVVIWGSVTYPVLAISTILFIPSTAIETHRQLVNGSLRITLAWTWLNWAKHQKTGHLLGQAHGPIWSSRLGLADFQIPPANRTSSAFGKFQRFVHFPEYNMPSCRANIWT